MVYFKLINGDTEPRIKVGFTTNHKKRDKAHEQSKLGVRVQIDDLCKIRGSATDEKAIQRHFAKHLLPDEKEIFHPDPEIIDYIRWLRDQYYVWVPDDPDCDDIESHDAVHSDNWLPGPGRLKQAPAERGLFTEYGPLCLAPRTLTVDDFYTDPNIIKAARSVLGTIDLDPSSHPVANRVVKATRFFTLHDDGLSKPWSGCVWLNPPFSEWKSWVPKIIAEWQSGNVSQMCVLCATRTLTAQYFWDIHQHCTSLCIFRGRIPFWGGLAASPDDGHVVFYFGDSADRFGEAFKNLGQTYSRVP